MLRRRRRHLGSWWVLMALVGVLRGESALAQGAPKQPTARASSSTTATAADSGTASPASSGAAASASATPPASAPAQASAENFRWDVPDVVHETEIAGEVRVGGVPVRMRAVVSRWPLEALVQHFATRFERAGFFIAPRQRSPVAQPSLTAFDARARRTWTVLFDRGPDGMTTLVLGSASWSAPRPSRGEDFAPMFPGAVGALRSEDEGVEMLGFQARAEEAEIHAYYRELLVGAGYEAGEGSVFRRGSKEIALTTRRLADGRTHALLVHRTVSGAPAVDDQ